MSKARKHFSLSGRVPVTVGSLLTESIRVLFSNFIPFVFIMLLANLPVIGFNYYWGRGFEDGSLIAPNASMLYFVVNHSLAFLGTSFGLGSITYGVVQFLAGRKAGTLACIQTGLSRSFAVLLVAITSGLIIGLGYICLIIPGVVLYFMLYVAVPATVVEGVGVKEALGRSKYLTQGHKVTIFGLGLIMTVIGFGVGTAYGALFLSGVDQSNFLVFSLLLQLLTIPLSAWTASAAAVTYNQLRTSKESTDVSDLAAVFS